MQGSVTRIQATSLHRALFALPNQNHPGRISETLLIKTMSTAIIRDQESSLSRMRSLLFTIGHLQSSGTCWSTEFWGCSATKREITLLLLFTVFASAHGLTSLYQINCTILDNSNDYSTSKGRLAPDEVPKRYGQLNRSQRKTLLAHRLNPVL